jgi:DNA-binding transcriptional regulator PaaX
MRTRPLNVDSRLMLLMLAAEEMQATGRMLLRWWEKNSRRGRVADLLRKLQAAGWVASGPGPLDGRIFALTTAGQQQVWGALDPEARWARSWDRTWRLAMFDVPQARVALRTKLRRKLRELQFGWLQNSVWLSPDPVSELMRELNARKVSVESLLFIEGRPAGGENDAELVAGAWDFARLAKLHADYLKLLRQRPAAGRMAKSVDWSAWADAESRAWQAIARVDPFLPDALLPAGYAGKAAWQARREALQGAARALADASARA